MSFSLIFFIGFLIFLVPIAWLLKEKLLNRSVNSWPFHVTSPLTPPERELFKRLVVALPNHLIMPQVHLLRVLDVKYNMRRFEWIKKIAWMSADFVVCNADFDVVAVIELDDRSHDAAKRKRADATKDSAFRSAGIEVIRWHVRAMPDVATVRKAIGVA